MNFLTLNGFSAFGIDGRINHFFPGAIDCFRRNWRRRDLSKVMSKVSGDYVAIGFSDGGTLAHELAAYDRRCKGAVIHSGMWREPKIEPTHSPKILILTTLEDRTPTGRASEDAYTWWRKATDTYMKVDIPYMDSSDNRWYERVLKHQFRNGVDIIQAWLHAHFGYPYENPDQNERDNGSLH